MKTKGQFKRQATNLRKKLSASSFDVECAEHDFYENPCNETWKALDKARRASNDIYERLMATDEVIDHYDFYSVCEEQEETEAKLRELSYA